MRGKVRLDAVSGPLRGGEPFEFDQADIFIFGRAADCHARLPGDDPTASRHHFVLAIQPPRVLIRDLGSLNGTFVNGRKIGSRDPGETAEQRARYRFEEVELGDGDEIQVGTTTLRLSVEQPVSCPQCGHPVDGVTGREYAGRDDPRCPCCRQRAAGPEPARPEPAPAGAVASDAGDPVAALVHALAGRRGLQPQRPGQTPEIPGYQLVSKLGQGGMGAVYLARRLGDGAQVAIKVILAQRPGRGHAGQRRGVRQGLALGAAGEHPPDSSTSVPRNRRMRGRSMSARRSFSGGMCSASLNQVSSSFIASR
jgi:eukaryotic-like serine/threonine-protein kinase